MINSQSYILIFITLIWTTDNRHLYRALILTNTIVRRIRTNYPLLSSIASHKPDAATELNVFLHAKTNGTALACLVFSCAGNLDLFLLIFKCLSLAPAVHADNAILWVKYHLIFKRHILRLVPFFGYLHKISCVMLSGKGVRIIEKTRIWQKDRTENTSLGDEIL